MPSASHPWVMLFPNMSGGTSVFSDLVKQKPKNTSDKLYIGLYWQVGPKCDTGPHLIWASNTLVHHFCHYSKCHITEIKLFLQMDISK